MFSHLFIYSRRSCIPFGTPSWSRRPSALSPSSSTRPTTKAIGCTRIYAPPRGIGLPSFACHPTRPGSRTTPAAAKPAVKVPASLSRNNYYSKHIKLPAQHFHVIRVVLFCLFLIFNIPDTLFSVLDKLWCSALSISNWFFFQSHYLFFFITCVL